MLRTLLLLLLLSTAAASAGAQTQPSERVMRTYVPPEDLVSFQADVPLDRFLATLEPLFERETGKIVIDPEGLTSPIGVPIAGMHFMDAFNLVLRANRLTFRENERYFVLMPLPDETQALAGAAIATGEAPRGPAGIIRPGTQIAAGEVPLVSTATREVQINAILFEINASEARDKGVNWDVLLAAEDLDPGGGFRVDVSEIVDLFGGTIEGPAEISTATLTTLLRYYEREGMGRTLASPQVSVQSGEQGRIQIGTDFPFQTRDFAGNTVTQFLQTGIIVDVTPTLFTERVEVGGQEQDLEFIHLDVGVERSSGRVSSGAIPIVDRTRSDTKIVLLDGEQTIIAGLSSTQSSYERRGIPILKDLPGWFFGLRYLFGYEVTLDEERELVIILQADVLDSLPDRANRPRPDGTLYDERRRQVEEALRRAGEPARVDLETQMRDR
jgi:type IV pilus assembly protein PilQ